MIYHQLLPYVELIKTETRMVDTERSKNLPQLRIHFTAKEEFKIPHVLKPKKTQFCAKPEAGFTPLFGGDEGTTGMHVASVNAGSEELYVGCTSAGSRSGQTLATCIPVVPSSPPNNGRRGNAVVGGTREPRECTWPASTRAARSYT